MYKRIVVGYDGSSGSRKALEKAIELKKILPNMRMSVLYVNDDARQNVVHSETGAASSRMIAPPVDGVYAQYVPPELSEERRYASMNPEDPANLDFDYSKHMHNAIQQQLESHQVEADVLAVEGSPARTIVAFAEEQKVDLLIVGNSGKSGLQKFFVGSVSEKVLKESPCSVLVVK